MRKRRSIIIGFFLLTFFAACSRPRIFPTRTQVEKRKSDRERLNDAVKERERDIHRMRGTSRDDPFPRY
jgi:hypothetical protein